MPQTNSTDYTQRWQLPAISFETARIVFFQSLIMSPRAVRKPPEDHLKFVSFLIKEKAWSPFFLYADCLMTDHIHLLLERQQETVEASYSAFSADTAVIIIESTNTQGTFFRAGISRSYARAIDTWAELVRYIHLNPVRARMVHCLESACTAEQIGH